ncbi:hypothetical protein TRIUR3_34140 [Triticum urartu]|uniref:Uncharacterized protein n=1 Tax=Triticum urartu TaxID=4572 RepID=M7XDH6_TRIUA|nr:hypothetical protein TRIUR3_34140 [Triticum urartu]
MKQRGLIGGHVMMDEHRMVALSGAVVAPTAARAGKILLSSARPSSSLCAAREGSPLDQSLRQSVVVVLAGDLAVPSAPPSISTEGLADVEVARRGRDRALALPIPIRRGSRLGVGGRG